MLPCYFLLPFGNRENGFLAVADRHGNRFSALVKRKTVLRAVYGLANKPLQARHAQCIGQASKGNKISGTNHPLFLSNLAGKGENIVFFSVKSWTIF